MVRLLSTILLVTFLGFAAVARSQSGGERFTSFGGFALGTVTLADIRARLGPATLVETGDAGEYTASVCYATRDGYVTFLSGELGGLDHDLLGYGLSHRPERAPCLDWPNSIQPPNLSIGGLRLGMSISEFTELVTVPIRWDGQLASASFQSKRKMTEPEISRLPEELREKVSSGEEQDYYDVVVSIVATFKGGRLQDVKTWKTETW